MMKDILKAEFLYDDEQRIYKVNVMFLDKSVASYTTQEEIIAVSAQLKEQQLRILGV